MHSNQSAPTINDFRPPQALPEPTSSLQQTGILLVSSSTALAVGITALRMYAKGKAKRYWWDDALLCTATVLSVAQAVSAYFAIKTAYLGIHIEDVPEHDPVVPLRWQFIIQLWYSPILGAVKASVLLFMLRLTSHMARIRWTIHALNALNVAMVATILLVVIVQCGPVEFNWDKSVGGVCIDQGWFYVSTAALTIFTDLLVLILPFWVFLGLHMARGIKIAIICVFLLGAVVPAVGTYRLMLLYQTFFGPPPPDPTYSISLTSSVIECNLAIVTASAPALRGLFRCWLPQLFSNSKPSNYPYKYSIKLLPQEPGSQVFLGRPCEADSTSAAGSTAATVIDFGYSKRVTRDAVTRDVVTRDVVVTAGLEDTDTNAPIGTSKDNRTTLVIIELEDGGSWAHAMENNDWVRRKDELRYSASPV